mgnify:CR=1 FL=1
MIINTLCCYCNKDITITRYLSEIGDIIRYHQVSDIIRYHVKEIGDIIRYHLTNLIDILKRKLVFIYYKKDTSSSSSSSSSSKNSYSLGTRVISYRYHITSSFKISRVIISSRNTFISIGGL